MNFSNMKCLGCPSNLEELSNIITHLNEELFDSDYCLSFSLLPKDEGKHDYEITIYNFHEGGADFLSGMFGQFLMWNGPAPIIRIIALSPKEFFFWKSFVSAPQGSPVLIIEEDDSRFVIDGWPFQVSILSFWKDGYFQEIEKITPGTYPIEDVFYDCHDAFKVVCEEGVIRSEFYGPSKHSRER